MEIVEKPWSTLPAVRFYSFISLLVGGIGSHEHHAGSVTERTREIGIRKALGATYNNIHCSFDLKLW